MANRTTADVVIVGNGALGLSVAVETALRDPALRVTVIGPAARPEAATVAAGAMLNCYAEVTARTGEHPAARAKFALAREAAQLWPGWLARLAEATPGTTAPVTVKRGTLVVLGARTTGDGARSMRAIRTAAKEQGEPFQDADPYGLGFLEPEQGEQPVDALYLENEGAVDARQVLAALDAAAAALGVGRISDEAVSLTITGDTVTGVRLSSGEDITAGAVVLAAGAATGRLIEQLPAGTVQPMLSGTGMALETRRVRGTGMPYVVRTPTLVGGCGLHAVPLGGGTEYLGATNLVLFDPQDGQRMGLVQALLSGVAAQFDRKLALSAVRRWHYGLRPVTLDTFPLLGRGPLPGLFFATGTYRDGFHASPAIARHMAGLLLTGTGDDTPADSPYALFAPGRRPIETTTVDEAAERFAEMALLVAVERGMRLPYFLDTEPIAAACRRLANESVERLGTPIALAPEILGAVSEADAGRVRQVAAYLKPLSRRRPGAPARTHAVPGRAILEA
ncbi:FAD-binding oxidoreductase [Streptomyces sp. UNOC14_S4]|uniref:NAD(P)/FAD-dependent oxidoreductase n=1 Tax=Streptomyces sp. UNOC14_S4 TaxID=2872340 RepID=UPI001E2CE0EF|nr:FAD-binding oxidoreductase [Streptomyces sp. UNOC14_S4]MCC3768780.1 FAD-binding oxidoreductase [Streptomyces sp. UNOC14_S4]